MSEELLPVALLAGGLATRLRPLTQTMPKALLAVAGQPFIFHQLQLLRKKGIEQVTICAGYLGEMIQEAVGDGSRFDLQVSYSFDGQRLLGTAGAIRKALPLLDEAFFTLYGDSYLPCDYASVQAAFETAGRPGLMTVFPNAGRWDRSNVAFAQGRILAYDKRQPTPEMRHIDYGLGVFRRGVFERLPPDRPSDLADVYQDLLDRGELAGWEVAERFYEIGSLHGLEEARQHLAADETGLEVGSLELR